MMRQAPQGNPDVDAYIAGLSEGQQAIVSSLRRIIAEAAPQLTEEFKWSRPVYTGRKGVCYIHANKAHVNLGFNRGAELADPESLLEGTGSAMRHVKIKSHDDLDHRPLEALVRAAVKLDAQG